MAISALPLIERHFSYDKDRFIVIEPRGDETLNGLMEEHGLRHVQAALTEENYKDILKPLLTEGGGQGFCVNLSVDTGSLGSLNSIQKISRRPDWMTRNKNSAART